jgi:very-short-patch-repair endonuclease/rubredoxin
MGRKHTIEYVKEYFQKFGYQLLESVYINSGTKMRYICDKDHENSMTFSMFYNQNHRCPVCAGNQKLTIEYVKEYFQKFGYKCLETDYQDSNTKMKYICDKGHESSIRFGCFKAGQRCPVCAGVQKYTFDYVKNFFGSFGYICLENEYINSKEKMRYICDKGHESSITFSSFKIGRRCYECFGSHKHTIDYVKSYFEKFGYHCLESKYLNSGTKMKYICDKGHENSMTFSMFYNQSHRCPICSGSQKHTIENVKKYFESFGYTCLENDYKDSHKKMKYICDKGHESETRFNDFKSGYRCPVCAGTQKHTFDYVKNFFESFGYICLEKEYINNREKMRYICDKGHKSSMSFHSFNAGHRCAFCKNKTEQIVNKFLEENYTNIISQPKFEWCKNKTHLPFDFLLDNFSVCIEVDGLQHFKKIRNWGTPEKNQERDVFKMKLAVEHGYSVIRIFQEDIYNNSINWKEMLKNCIKKYNSPTIIYISKNIDLYNNHKSLLEKI